MLKFKSTILYDDDNDNKEFICYCLTDNDKSIDDITKNLNEKYKINLKISESMDYMISAKLDFEKYDIMIENVFDTYFPFDDEINWEIHGNEEELKKFVNDNAETGKYCCSVQDYINENPSNWIFTNDNEKYLKLNEWFIYYDIKD